MELSMLIAFQTSQYTLLYSCGYLAGAVNGAYVCTHDQRRQQLRPAPFLNATRRNAACCAAFDKSSYEACSLSTMNYKGTDYVARSDMAIFDIAQVYHRRAWGMRISDIFLDQYCTTRPADRTQKTLMLLFFVHQRSLNLETCTPVGYCCTRGKRGRTNERTTPFSPGCRIVLMKVAQRRPTGEAKSQTKKNT